MNAFVDRLKEIKTRMTKDGSETLYLTLPQKSPGGPGIDALIGTLFSAQAPPPSAVVVQPPAPPPPAPAPASSQRQSRSRSRDRGDRDRHRRDNSPRRQNQNGRNGRDNGGNNGRDNDRRDSKSNKYESKGSHGEFCLENFMEVLGVRRFGCGYEENCKYTHLKKAGNTRSLSQVERQVLEELRGNEGARLMEALRTHGKSPYAQGHSSSK
jgi:hypothetical protein